MKPVTRTEGALASAAPDRQPAAPLVGWIRPWLVVVLIVVLLSGGLFGYDQGVISGALHGIKLAFALSPLLVEVVTSWVTLGALFGALAGGEMADRLGRKRTILIAALLFTLGSLVEGLAPGTLILIIGRLIVGLGVGVAAVAAPLYAAELAPTRLRGRFISAYQLAITIGIFIAYLVDSWLAKSGAWRIMLGASAVVGLMLLAVALLAPESPRWLMKMHRRPDATAELAKIRSAAELPGDLDDIAGALGADAHRASWRETLQRRWRRPLLIGMGGSLAIVGAAFHFMTPLAQGAKASGPTVAGIVTLVALVAYIMSFAFSIGPVVWTVINEIFPGRIRGRGVAIATAVNWGAAFLVSQCFLSLIGAVGDSLTFLLFALFCGLGWAWIYHAVPETKGRSLEQIEQFWKEPA
jgi:MFS family permease